MEAFGMREGKEDDETEEAEEENGESEKKELRRAKADAKDEGEVCGNESRAINEPLASTFVLDST